MNVSPSHLRAQAAACVLFAFVATPARAQRLTLEGLQTQIKALTAIVAHQAATINALGSQLALVQGNTVLALHQRLTYDAATQTARFSGVDVRVDNGSGPGTINGRGNLIVGFNTGRSAYAVCANGTYADEASCLAAGATWAANHKSGSHNLVVGEQHAYSSNGGVVFGQSNAITQLGSTVTGGALNISRGLYSNVSGGDLNTASARAASVAGGSGNQASGESSSVGGGVLNTASGLAATVIGGQDNKASGNASSVGGGSRNTASGDLSSVSGGNVRSAPNLFDWAAGSLFENE